MNITDMREPVRAILGDFNSAVRKYADSAIDTVTRTCLRLGRAEGLAVGNAGVIEPTPSGRQLALLTYEVCRALLAPEVGAYGYRLRAVQERIGDRRVFFFDLLGLLEEVRSRGEDGVGLKSEADFAGWVTSVTGQNIWARQAVVEVPESGVAVTVEL